MADIMEVYREVEQDIQDYHHEIHAELEEALREYDREILEVMDEALLDDIDIDEDEYMTLFYTNPVDLIITPYGEGAKIYSHKDHIQLTGEGVEFGKTDLEWFDEWDSADLKDFTGSVRDKPNLRLVAHLNSKYGTVYLTLVNSNEQHVCNIYISKEGHYTSKLRDAILRNDVKAYNRCFKSDKMEITQAKVTRAQYPYTYLGNMIVIIDK